MILGHKSSIYKRGGLPYICAPVHHHSIHNETLTLMPEKVIWWEAQKMLIVADVHLGKGMHFRKAGIPLPLLSQQKDFVVLEKLFQTPELKTVVFLGDLFHSSYNSEWELLGLLLKKYAHLQFILVQGNHDILHIGQYRRFGFEVYDILNIEPFVFSHEPLTKPSAYNIYGHIHPGIRMVGGGRQRIKLPCFFFSGQYAVVPSFGQLTGLYALAPKKTDTIYAIAEGKIFPVF